MFFKIRSENPLNKRGIWILCNLNEIISFENNKYDVENV